MKKTDIGLIIMVAIFAFALMLLNAKQLTSGVVQSYEVVIRVDGELYKTYSLEEEAEIHVDTEYGFNVIFISNREVAMTDADCKDQICINTKSIKRPGQSIVCLPHRVSVEILGATLEESEVDEISQ